MKHSVRATSNPRQAEGSERCEEMRVDPSTPKEPRADAACEALSHPRGDAIKPSPERQPRMTSEEYHRTCPCLLAKAPSPYGNGQSLQPISLWPKPRTDRRSGEHTWDTHLRWNCTEAQPSGGEATLPTGTKHKCSAPERNLTSLEP